MFDTEKFIYEIEKRSSIWDSRAESYRNKVIKSNHLSDVCREMYPEWNDFSDNVKQQKGKELVTKWKSIKDKYRKCVKENNSPKSGAAAQKKKKNIYYSMLEFLRPVIEEHILSSNIPTDDDSTQESTHTETDSIHNKPTVTRKYTKKADNDDQIDQNKELLEILKQRNEKEVEFMRDEDTLFALSLVQSLKEMPTAIKLRTKTEIMSVIEKNTYYGYEYASGPSHHGYTAQFQSNQQATTFIAQPTSAPPPPPPPPPPQSLPLSPVQEIPPILSEFLNFSPDDDNEINSCLNFK